MHGVKMETTTQEPSLVFEEDDSEIVARYEGKTYQRLEKRKDGVNYYVFGLPKEEQTGKGINYICLLEYIDGHRAVGLATMPGSLSDLTQIIRRMQVWEKTEIYLGEQVIAILENEPQS